MPTIISGDNGVDKVQAGSIQFDDVSAGMVIQVDNYTTGAVATGTATIPYDNTIPQITEGTQFMSLAFTPKKANSKLKIDVVFNGKHNIAGSSLLVSLFDGTSNAIMTQALAMPSASYISQIVGTKIYQVASLSPITFSVRAGSNTASTVTFNNEITLGGVMASSITITEISQ
jgi:hypothetical protein